MSRKSNQNNVELSEMKGRGYSPNQQPYQQQPQAGEPRGTRTNSSLAVAFEELRARMNTHKLADDSRRVTRKSKGLDPVAPRPKQDCNVAYQLSNACKERTREANQPC
jgi:hypothetical protein